MLRHSKQVVMAGILLTAVLFGYPSGRIEPALAQARTDNLHPTEVFRFSPSARSVAAAFKEADKPYYLEDEIAAFPDPALGLGGTITVRRALPVEITDGKKTYTARTWEDSVGGLLGEKNISLGNDDQISLAPNTALVASAKLTIVRVAKTVVSEFETIKFEVIEKENASMWRGERKVTQEGKNGKREKKYLVVREDGEQVSKTLQSETIAEKAVNKVIEIGTKLKIGQVFTGKATYYENNLGTKVATDKFKRGTTLRVTNLANGKSMIVVNDGCICGATGVLIDLSPAYFQQLGGTLFQGILPSVRVEEVLN